jgi:hypothetical protein
MVVQIAKFDAALGLLALWREAKPVRGGLKTARYELE